MLHHSRANMSTKLLLALLALAVGVHSHGVQVAHCVKPDGYLRIYIETWHNDLPLSQLTGNNDITIRDLVANTQSAVDPMGSVWNTPVNQLPGCGANIVVDTACAGEANMYNDWAFYDYQPTCNVPAAYRLLQGNSVVFDEACPNLYPVDITGTFLDNSPPIFKVNGELCSAATRVAVADACQPQTVAFAPTVGDACDPAPTWSIDHAATHVYQLGCTTVTMSGSDNAVPPNTGSCAFQVCLDAPAAGCCPDDSALSATTTDVLCHGTATGQIAASMSAGAAPFVYAWSDGQTTPTAVGLAAGTYEVTATDANGCHVTKSYAMTQPATAVTVTTSANAWIMAGWPGSNCHDISAAYSGGTGARHLAWNDGSTTDDRTVCPTQNATFTATVTDDSGCSASATTKICALDVTCEHQFQQGDHGNGHHGTQASGHDETTGNGHLRYSICKKKQDMNLCLPLDGAQGQVAAQGDAVAVGRCDDHPLPVC